MEVELLAPFWEDAATNGDRRAHSFRGILERGELPMVLNACHSAVRDDVNAIPEDGETDDGPSRVLSRLTDIRRQVTAETDLLDFMSCSYDKVAPLFVGHAVGAKNLAAATAAYRQAVIDEIARWPFWLVICTNYADYSDILGMTVDEVRDHQRALAEEEEHGVAALRVFLH